MKTLRRIISLLMSLVLLLGICACDVKPSGGKQEESSTTSGGGGYSSNSSGDYESTVSGWQETDDETKEEFDNSDAETIAPTPGSSTQQTVVNVTRPIEPEEVEKPVRGSVLASGYEFSELMDAENLQYIYKGKNYAYGITKDNKEYIAFMDEYGDMVDVYNGGGRIQIQNTVNATLLASGDLTDWTETMLDSWHCIIAHYELTTGGASNEFYEVRYVFKENSIAVSAKIRFDSTTPVAGGSLNRAYINPIKSETAKVNTKWEYPTSGDQPYLEFESLAYRTQFTDSINVYTFVRTLGQETSRMSIEKFSSTGIPIDADGESMGMNLEVKYDLSFVDTSTENNQGADYLGLFKSFDSQFAAGIAPIDDPGDNSTVFVGDSVRLNLNVTNLVDKDLKFSLRYDVMNHYNEVVDSGLFVDNTIYQYADANREIEISGKYGMYYLNLYVITEFSTYREHYPFALLEDYEYKYWDTNPYAINSVNAHKSIAEEYINSGKLLGKLGSASYRTNLEEGYKLVTKQLQKNGVTRLYGAVNLSVPEEGNRTDQEVAKRVADMMKSVDNLVETYGDIEWIEIGNEFNMAAITEGAEKTETELYPLWYKYIFEPSYEAITKKYPDIKYLPTSDAACSGFWQRCLAFGYLDENDKRVGQAWDKVNTITTHIYGPPYMPDAYALSYPDKNKPGEGLWHIEPGMQRMESVLSEYSNGNPNRVDFVISEIGYRSPPRSLQEVDYRTHGDYTVRIGAICPAYTADVVQYYCMYDRTSYITGIDHAYAEMHFGLFYEQDYYGIAKPKPSGVAFGVMTRQLESYKKDSAYIDYDYDEGWWTGGVRAFSFDTDLYGKVEVAWSNKDPLANGKKRTNGTVGDRTPLLPWMNQWVKTDETVFKAAGETVKVVDTMGNATTYTANSKGEVTIPLTGSPVYIYGLE